MTVISQMAGIRGSGVGGGWGVGGGGGRWEAEGGLRLPLRDRQQ